MWMRWAAAGQAGSGQPSRQAAMSTALFQISGWSEDADCSAGGAIVLPARLHRVLGRVTALVFLISHSPLIFQSYTSHSTASQRSSYNQISATGYRLQTDSFLMGRVAGYKIIKT